MKFKCSCGSETYLLSKEAYYGPVSESPPIIEKKSKLSGCWVARCHVCHAIWVGRNSSELEDDMYLSGVLV